MQEQIEKQAIEEMAKEICCICHGHTNCVNTSPCTMAFVEAEELYKSKGYRKQSEGWIEFSEIGAMNNFWECSVCHWKTVSFTEMKHSNFCPNCGAKMKGGAE